MKCFQVAREGLKHCLEKCWDHFFREVPVTMFLGGERRGLNIVWRSLFWISFRGFRTLVLIEFRVLRGQFRSADVPP